MENKIKVDFEKFRKLSVERAIHGFNTYENVPVLFFTTALAGEVGELCNAIKKIERAKVGGLDAGPTTKAADVDKKMLQEEIGGIFIYLDLLCARLGLSLEEAIVYTFNSKSEKHNLPYFIE